MIIFISNFPKRYEKMIGERNFEHYARQRKEFGPLCKNVEDFYPTSKKLDGEKSFGLIPNKIVSKLIDKSNSNVRGEASEMLHIEIAGCVKIQDIIPFLKSFLEFLSNLLEDINSRVVINILDTILVLQKRLPSNMRCHLNLLTRMLLKINSEGKKEMKISIYQNVKQLMSNGPVLAVVDELLEVAATEKTGRVREEVLCLLSLCLLTFPSSDLDLQTISQTAAGALADRTRRVRQAAMECLALAAQCLGHQRRGRLMEFVCELDRRERSHGEMVSAVRARISRKCLPRLTCEGLVEFGLTVQGQDCVQPGPDLEWILRGSSHGQARWSRVDSGGAGAGLKPRTPSLPPMGNRPEQDSVGKIRSTSLYDNTKRVIPDIVKHSAPPPLRSEDREEPCDLGLASLLNSTPSPTPEAYQTFSRSESLVDLRDLPSSHKQEAQHQQFDVKKCSLVSLGLASFQHQTIFDSENKADADSLPGAFKNPSAALQKAIKDLESEEWQVEVAGLGALVRIAEWNRELLNHRLSHILGLVRNEVRNPRSQVAKAAVQTFTKLFSLLGQLVEREKIFEEIVKTLLIRTGDTNKFIRNLNQNLNFRKSDLKSLRVDASDCLDTMVENVSIKKAVTTLISCGLNSKNVMIRICVAFLLLHIVKSLGKDLFFASSKDTAYPVVRASAQLLEDGNLDVRTYAKALVKIIISHEKFESYWTAAIKDETKLKNLQKIINSLK